MNEILIEKLKSNEKKTAVNENVNRRYLKIGKLETTNIP